MPSGEHHRMKLVLTMVCSALLVGTPFLPARTLAACARQPARACCHGGVMPCCAARPSPGSPSVPAVPAPSVTQNQFSLLAPAVIAWTLPHQEARPHSFATGWSLTTAGAPLFARNCARLI